MTTPSIQTRIPESGLYIDVVPSTGYGAGDAGKVLGIVAGKVALLTPSSGAFTNLTATRWVDAGTAVPIGAQDGNIETPFATIQQAVNALAATGGAVIVNQGSYLETVDISAVLGDITIEALSTSDVVGQGNSDAQVPLITAITSGASTAAITLTLSGLNVSTNVDANGLYGLQLNSTTVQGTITMPNNFFANKSIVCLVDATNLLFAKLTDCTHRGVGYTNPTWAPANTNVTVEIYRSEITSAATFTLTSGQLWLDAYSKNYWTWYLCVMAAGSMFVVDEVWPTYNLVVDPSLATVSTPDGSEQHPFNTAQAAVDYIQSLGPSTYGGVSITILEGNAGNVALNAAYLYNIEFNGPGSINNLDSSSLNTQLYYLVVRCGVQGSVNLVAAGAGFLASSAHFHDAYFTSTINLDLAGGEVDLHDCANSTGITVANGTLAMMGGNGYPGPITDAGGAFVVIQSCVVAGNLAVAATSEWRAQCGARVGNSGGSWTVAAGGILDIRGPATVRSSITNAGTLTTSNTAVWGGVTNTGTWVDYSDTYNANDPTKWTTSTPTSLANAIDRIAAALGPIA
jgi:hypothetical protein